MGAFYPPHKVIIDPETLKTLDERQLHSGLVEAIKMSATCNEDLFNLIFNKIADDTNKFVCESKEGNITLMYDENGIIGYTATNIEYELEEQQEIAKEIGIDAYLEEFNDWFESHSTGTCVIEGKESNDDLEVEEEKKEEVEETNTKVVGNSDYGFVSVPENWVRFQDVSGSDAFQYSFVDIFIVTLDYIEDNSFTAEDYASTYMAQQKADSTVTGVSGAMVKIGKNDEYSAYQVYMYYPADDVYLITYWFETGDGKIRYIALEGPENFGDLELDDYLEIPKSFSLTSGV